MPTGRISRWFYRTAVSSTNVLTGLHSLAAACVHVAGPGALAVFVNSLIGGVRTGHKPRLYGLLRSDSKRQNLFVINLSLIVSLSVHTIVHSSSKVAAMRPAGLWASVRVW